MIEYKLYQVVTNGDDILLGSSNVSPIRVPLPDNPEAEYYITTVRGGVESTKKGPAFELALGGAIYSTDWSDLDGWTVDVGTPVVSNNEFSGGSIFRTVEVPDGFDIYFSIGSLFTSGEITVGLTVPMEEKGVSLHISTTEIMTVVMDGGTPSSVDAAVALSPHDNIVLEVRPEGITVAYPGGTLVNNTAVPAGVADMLVEATGDTSVGVHTNNNLFEVKAAGALPYTTTFPVTATGLGPGWTYFGAEADYYCDADGAAANVGSQPAMRDFGEAVSAWEIVLSVMPGEGKAVSHIVSLNLATSNGYEVVAMASGFIRVNKITGGAGSLLAVTSTAVYSAGQALRIVPTATGLDLSVNGTPVLTTADTDYLGGTAIASGISDTVGRIRSISVE